ncbi:MAG: 3-hydroxybutyryl-CoA dehydrogenase, partial [Mycobacterium sp.]|nr:3-hydroxybutyryl-CoA dehydrogenase [Mycobacterium sp.]
MGGGIAEVCAKAGAHVLVYEPTEELTAAGKARITASLDRAAAKGKLSDVDRDAALGNLVFTTSLGDLADRQLVIEAIIEDEDVKAKLFAELDTVITDPDAVLASNTSSIPIMKIAAATK